MKQLSIYDYPIYPITYETRKESYESLDLGKKQRQVLEIFQEMDKPMTAKEVAIEMKKRGYSLSDERNSAAPRIHELLENGVLDCIGKKKCEYTGKMVSLFKLRSRK